MSPTKGLERRTLCANETRHTTDISTTLARNVGRARKVPAMIVVIVALRLCAPMNNPSAEKPSLACPEGHKANQGPPPPLAPLPDLGADCPQNCRTLVASSGLAICSRAPETSGPASAAILGPLASTWMTTSGGAAEFTTSVPRYRAATPYSTTATQNVRFERSIRRRQRAASCLSGLVWRTAAVKLACTVCPGIDGHRHSAALAQASSSAAARAASSSPDTGFRSRTVVPSRAFSMRGQMPASA